MRGRDEAAPSSAAASRRQVGVEKRDAGSSGSAEGGPGGRRGAAPQDAPTPEEGGILEPEDAGRGIERARDEPSGFTLGTPQQRIQEWIRSFSSVKNLKGRSRRRVGVAPPPSYMDEGLDNRRETGELGPDNSYQDYETESSESETEAPAHPSYRPRSLFGRLFGGPERRTQSPERRTRSLERPDRV